MAVDRETREKLDRLGRAYAMVTAAHYTLRASVGYQQPLDHAVRQWAQATEAYALAVDELVMPTPPKRPAVTPQEVVAEVRSKLVGRIEGGVFKKNGAAR